MREQKKETIPTDRSHGKGREIFVKSPAMNLTNSIAGKDVRVPSLLNTEAASQDMMVQASVSGVQTPLGKQWMPWL